MRNNLEAAFAAGVHIAFFSANAMYWQVRFESSPNGGPNPVMVGYKENAPSFDPLFNDPILSTVRFRDAPVNRPENRLLGVMYGWDTSDWNGYPLVVTNSAHRVYRNTGLTNGQSLYGMVGYEWDNLEGVTASSPNPATIAGLAVLADSPTSPGSHHNSVTYQNGAGTRFFSGGSINWCWGLDNYNSPINSQDTRVRQITTNVLVDMTSLPATPSPGIVVAP
jgi:hypothetical protein